jgi:hypothetical protein
LTAGSQCFKQKFALMGAIVTFSDEKRSINVAIKTKNLVVRIENILNIS